MTVQTLLLIRHGQASFHGPQYDVLSELGRDQGRHLGRYLVGQRHKPIEVVFTGPRRRQRDTAAAMREGAAGIGATLPDAVVVEELDEYPAIALLKRGLPVLCDGDDELRGWLGPLASSLQQRDLPSFGAIPGFERVFRRVQRAWMTSALTLDGVETFADFKRRVCRVLARIAEEAAGRRAALVTSGGPVAMALQLALDLSDHKAMRMSEVVANTGLTSLRRTHDEWLVTSFNALPHLPERSLITYR